MSKKFKKLLVPEGYRHYWSKYPEGYTILEALLNWVDSVNQLTDNVNDWNLYLEDFVEKLDKELETTARALLNEMEQDGRLSDLINDVIFSELNDKVDAAFKGIHTVKHSDKTVVSQSTRGSLVILDDDVRSESYDLLFGFAKLHNVKVTMAVITERVMNGNSYHISIEQLKEMRDNDLVEFVNHSHTHPRLTELSDGEIIEEFEKSQRFLTSHGIFTDHLVYPYGGGAIDERVKRITSQYFNSASRSNGFNVSPHNEVIDSLELNRVVFEASEATISDRISQAAQNGSTLILNTHSQYETFDLAKLERIVNMANSAGIDILHFSEAFERFKNPIEIRKDNDKLLGGISSQGVQAGIFDPDIKRIILGDTDITNSSLPNAYEIHKITNFEVTAVLKDERNFPAAGRLLNFRLGSDDYTFQLLHEVNTGHIFKRQWKTVDLQWSSWVNITDNQKDIRMVTEDDFTVDNDSPAGDYERRIISSFDVTRNIRDNRGFPAVGRMFNYRSWTDDYTFQMLHEYGSHSIYKRYWDNVNGEWSEWVNIVGGEKHTFIEEDISIAPNEWQNLKFDVPGVVHGDVVNVTFASALYGGIIITSPFVVEDDRVQIRLNNVSAITVTIDELKVIIKKM